MALVALDGSPLVPIGPGYNSALTVPTVSPVILDAAGEATIFIGHVITSDGSSHTINTTGSSSLSWQSLGSTFANAGTTVTVGLAAVLTTAGPPGRAANAADVITFDVSKSLTGGSGSIPANSWQTHVPDAGSKTIANGDLVAFCIQMTARGGVDSVTVAYSTASQANHRPAVTGFTGATYNIVVGTPIAIITFSDGVLGYFQASDCFSTLSTRIWNSGSATREYGQLYNLPFPIKIYGLYGWIDPDADCDVILYSDPLGTPVAEKTVSLDANTMVSSTARRFTVAFASPYTTTTGQSIGVVYKPGASNVTAFYRTLASATHRVTEPYGANGYGIGRVTGAFADVNSGLEHYYIGLIAGAFDAGGAAGRAVQINSDSLVA